MIESRLTGCALYLKDVRGRGFKKTTPVDIAFKTWMRNFLPYPSSLEFTSLEGAIGRILGKDIIAEENIPSFEKSAMDGYAVKAEDTFPASITNPIKLRLVGETLVSGPKYIGLKNMETVAVTTGSPIPENSDAVVMLEFTKRDNAYVEIYHPVSPFENVVRAGDDIRKGDRVFTRGRRLNPYDIGVLKALGLRDVPVVKRLRVGLISTGNELVDSISDEPYKTVDVNRPVLTGMLAELGSTSIDFGIIEDDVELIRDKVSSAMSKADMVVVTGGTSVGETDNVPEALNSLGSPGVLVHGVSIRPGMPIGLGVVEGKPVVSLPGNPVAAIVGFLKFIKPALLRMVAAQDEPVPKVRAKLTRRVVSPPGFRSFVRVYVKERDGDLEADPVMTLGSNILSSMVKANGIMEVEEAVEGVEAGEEVEITLYRAID